MHGKHMPRRGFTYLALLLWLAIAGVALAGLGQMWSQDARRGRETELVFRGREYARALGAYAADHDSRYPERLDELLADTSKGQLRRYLRRSYPDPVTNSAQWGLVMEEGRIRGVYSDSPMKPLRRMDGVETYRDWRFMAEAPMAASAPAGADAAASSPADAPSSPFTASFPKNPGRN